MTARKIGPITHISQSMWRQELERLAMSLWSAIVIIGAFLLLSCRNCGNADSAGTKTRVEPACRRSALYSEYDKVKFGTTLQELTIVFGPPLGILRQPGGLALVFFCTPFDGESEMASREFEFLIDEATSSVLLKHSIRDSDPEGEVEYATSLQRLVNSRLSKRQLKNQRLSPANARAERDQTN